MTLKQLSTKTRRKLISLSLGTDALARDMSARTQDQRTYAFTVLGLDTRAQDANQLPDSIVVSRVDEVIDAVGGSEVDNPYRVKVSDFPNFSEGRIFMDGAAMD